MGANRRFSLYDESLQNAENNELSLPINSSHMAYVDAKLICKHKGLIPDSNVKACQPI